MEVDAQRVVIGLTTGAAYGLLALGFVIIYRASKVLNFAEAGVGAVGAYLLYDFMEGSGGGWGRFLLAMAAGPAAAALLGVAIERLAIRPLRRAPAIAPLVATVGVLLLAQAVVTIRYTGQAVTIENPLPSEPYRIGRLLGLDRVVITGEGTVLLAVLLVVGLALILLVGRTRWGLAVRAVSEDRDSAAELGVRTGRVSMSAWALGSAVGALASMLFATTSLLTPVNLAFLQVKALVVAVFAGLSDLRLCLIGGPLLGVVEQLATRFGGASGGGIAGLDQSIGFFALLVVLLLRANTLVAEARA
jgi:branched-chain amino acid transport system permease protein